MTAASRERQRVIAREIALNEARLERERQTDRYDYDHDVNHGINPLLDIADDYLVRARGINGSRRDMVKALAMIVAALEVDTDATVAE